MKKILCYGDSNTFGFNPKNGKRFDENTRWSGILKNNLKDKFEIIEKGLNNRTAFANNLNGAEYCACLHLPKILEESNDIIALIFAVGINDFQKFYNINENDIEYGLNKIVKLMKNKNIQLIIIPPLILNERILKGNFSLLFDKTSVSKSKKMNYIYKKVAQDLGCHYFDFNKFAKPSDLDGLHYDEATHKMIALKMNDFLNSLF